MSVKEFSRKYYSGLTDSQHEQNNKWFEFQLNLLKNTGILYIPNIQKTFNKQGLEISKCQGDISPLIFMPDMFTT